MTGQSDPTWAIREGGSTGKVGHFGWTRDGGRKFHSGVDYLGPLGHTVFAAHKGQIERVGWQDRNNHARGYGLRVYLRGDGVETIYAHMMAVADDCIPGRRFAEGDPLGFLGTTGNTANAQGWVTPPHLHFGVRINSKWSDPLQWLEGGRYGDDRQG